MKQATDVPEFLPAPRGEWADYSMALGWVHGKLDLLQDPEGISWPKHSGDLVMLRMVHLNRRQGVASLGSQAVVERLWKTYFQNPSGCWDNRNDKVSHKMHFQSPGFRQKSTKEVESWSTPQLVTYALRKQRLATRAGGWNVERAISSSDGCRTGIAIDLKLPSHNEFTWTAFISK